MFKKGESPKKPNEKWSRAEKLAGIIIIIGLLSFICNLDGNYHIIDIFSDINNGNQYKNSCMSLNSNITNNLKSYEGKRVKFTGKIIDTSYTNDVRQLVLKTDSGDKICVWEDIAQRIGEEDDLVTIYGFVFGTRALSQLGYNAPLIISYHIDVNKTKYK
jgi:hypothetical protein